MVKLYQTVAFLGGSMISSTDLIGSMTSVPFSNHENSVGNVNMNTKQLLKQGICFEGG